MYLNPMYQAQHKITYSPWFSSLISIAIVSIFFTMSTEYDVLQNHSWNPGPQNMQRYFTHDFVISNDLLIAWGAQYTPFIILDNEWWRLFTSSMIHLSLHHCLANLTMIIIIGFYIEPLYGIQFFFIWMISVLYSNLWSALLQYAPCGVIVGASGGLYGILALYINNIIQRWNTLQLPQIHIAFISFVVIEFVSMLFDPKVSSISHISGFCCGYCMSSSMSNKNSKVFRISSAALIFSSMMLCFAFLKFKIYTCVY